MPNKPTPPTSEPADSHVIEHPVTVPRALVAQTRRVRRQRRTGSDDLSQHKLEVAREPILYLRSQTAHHHSGYRPLRWRVRAHLSGCALFSDAELPQVVLQVQINNPRYYYEATTLSSITVVTRRVPLEILRALHRWKIVHSGSLAPRTEVASGHSDDH